MFLVLHSAFRLLVWLLLRLQSNSQDNRLLQKPPYENHTEAFFLSIPADTGSKKREIFFRQTLEKSCKICYTGKASWKVATRIWSSVGSGFRISIWRCIEVVVTRTTRNRFVQRWARGFESHHLRQKSCQQPVFRLLVFLYLSRFSRALPEGSEPILPAAHPLPSSGSIIFSTLNQKGATPSCIRADILFYSAA